MAGLRSAGALLHPCRPPLSRPERSPVQARSAGASPASWWATSGERYHALRHPLCPRPPEPLRVSTFVLDMKSLAYAPASSML